jgi:hypothetical protein
MTRNLPDLAAPVLNKAAIRSDKKNDGASNRRADRGAYRPAGSRANSRADRGPGHYIAFKI